MVPTVWESRQRYIWRLLRNEYDVEDIDTSSGWGQSNVLAQVNAGSEALCLVSDTNINLATLVFVLGVVTKVRKLYLIHC